MDMPAGILRVLSIFFGWSGIAARSVQPSTRRGLPVSWGGSGTVPAWWFRLWFPG